jgi:pimeloyl-ACP methyl ester carboxylesterase
VSLSTKRPSSNRRDPSNDVNSRERRIAFDDGAETILESWGSGGPNLLCLHGMTSSRKAWRRTAAAMEPAYVVHAYDQRGHGDAAATKGPMTFARIVRDCLEVAGAIPGGVDTLIGHSWGGAIALLAGLELGVLGVVAIDPMFRARRAGWAAYWHEQMDPILGLRGAERERKIVEEYRNLPGVEVEAKIHALRNMTIEPLIGIGVENGADEGKLDLREAIVDYPKPLLVMLADESESVVHQEEVDFIRLHGGPNVTLRVFPGQGHSLHRTAFDDYIRALSAFIGAPFGTSSASYGEAEPRRR